jgi:hypothetical protein
MATPRKKPASMSAGPRTVEGGLKPRKGGLMGDAKGSGNIKATAVKPVAKPGKSQIAKYQRKATIIRDSFPGVQASVKPKKSSKGTRLAS